MAVAALDFGRRRIGIAVAEENDSVAYPVGAVERRSHRHDFEALRAILSARDVRSVVVGLPLNLDGSEGPQARAARNFARLLGEAIALPVELYDERLTSFEAEERLRNAPGRSGRIDKAAIDAVAAAIILEGWLQSRRAPGRRPPG
jgi:putative Holliday junction resolvase